ncbi:MAG: hypothetical protein CMJ48_09825 [Planctomycetaceae bacterium]|nr:hypothetical protein [Planctomycetaceae bacterium]
MPEPLSIECVNHISYVVRDLDASEAFYRNVLGFRPIFRPDFGFPGAWLFNYGVQIHLIGIGASEEPPAHPISIRADHVAYHVEDTGTVEGLLTEHGIEYKKNYVADVGVTQLFFHDPDGNHIEIGSYPPAQPV